MSLLINDRQIGISFFNKPLNAELNDSFPFCNTFSFFLLLQARLFAANGFVKIEDCSLRLCISNTGRSSEKMDVEESKVRKRCLEVICKEDYVTSAKRV